MIANEKFSLDTILNFGKHEGELLSDVAESDPYYVLWMIDNFDGAEFDDDVYDVACANLPTYKSFDDTLEDKFERVARRIVKEVRFYPR